MTVYQVILLAAIMAILQNAQPYKLGLQLLKLDKIYLLTCTLCSTFWVCMLYWLAKDVSFIELIGLSSLSAILAEFIDRELNRF